METRGTEKQINWAKDIIANWIDFLEKAKAQETRQRKIKRIDCAIDILKSDKIVLASIVIDQRKADTVGEICGAVSLFTDKETAEYLLFG